jgi:ABC-type hemin transport system ATPase subunit
MPDPDSQKAWNRFESDIQGLAGELKRQYRSAGGGEQNSIDLNRSLDQLRQAAETVFKSLENATRDPEVRSKTKQTARSFGSAIAETFRELSDEIEKAVRKPADKA